MKPRVLPSVLPKETETAIENFDSFVRANEQRLMSAAVLLLRDREESKEMVQEALTRVYLSWGTVSSMARPDLWAIRVLVNLCTSSLRRRMRFSGGAQAVTHFQETPEEVASSTDQLERMLRTLSRQRRKAIVLRYCLDLSIAETASVMKIKPGTVTALCAQGLDQLRAAMKEDANDGESRS